MKRLLLLLLMSTRAAGQGNSTQVPTELPTAQPTNAPVAPSSMPTIRRSSAPTSAMPSSSAPTSTLPTSAPTSTLPTSAPTSTRPTSAPTSTLPTSEPTSTLPTLAPTSALPTSGPTSTLPTSAPTTASPTSAQPSALPSSARPSTFLPTSAVPSAALSSFSPSSSQRPTSFPSTVPSIKPTSFPSTLPSSAPSLYPSSIPSIMPSRPPSLTPSRSPTLTPTLRPSSPPTQSSAPTFAPSLTPSHQPTEQRVPSESPSISHFPSISQFPSEGPSQSSQPSLNPTQSELPSFRPSQRPSQSPYPSLAPSSEPTTVPSGAPSDIPSTVPTREIPFIAIGVYRQTFVMFEKVIFDPPDEELLVEDLFAGFTEIYRPDSNRVFTMCDIVAQKSLTCSGDSDLFCINLPGVDVPGGDLFLNDVDYECRWTSRVTDVETFPEEFKAYIGANLLDVTEQMRNLTLTNVAFAQEPRLESPTTTVSPTLAPIVVTEEPTTRRPTPVPSVIPSLTPSLEPSSNHPTGMPVRHVATVGEPSAGPTDEATIQVPSDQPSGRPTESPSEKSLFPSAFPTTGPAISNFRSPQTETASLSTIQVSAIVLVAGLTALALLLACYRRRRKRGVSRPYYGESEVHAGKERPPPPKSSYAANHKNMYNGHPDGAMGGIMSPNDSLISRQSLLSAGGSGFGDESDQEADGTRNLQDEFDMYKDQNLEQLRSDVEGNLSGFEGIMSAAVTRALMGDDYPQTASQDLLWGCSKEATGAEIEASVLSEVSEWLKRKGTATVEQKRALMQDLLNRMVSSVRFGILRANDASRAIHESAALLGLQLAHELPVNTIIVHGMRKTTAASHMIAVMKEFGDIEAAAVAAGQRGFGIVRFRHSKAVEKAMRRYRTGEIVIKEVGVQMIPLTQGDAAQNRKS